MNIIDIEKLKDLMRITNCTQKDLSDLLEVSQMAISKKISLKVKFNMVEADILMKYFRCKFEHILTNEFIEHLELLKNAKNKDTVFAILVETKKLKGDV